MHTYTYMKLMCLKMMCVGIHKYASNQRGNRLFAGYGFVLRLCLKNLRYLAIGWLFKNAVFISTFSLGNEILIFFSFIFFTFFIFRCHHLTDLCTRTLYVVDARVIFYIGKKYFFYHELKAHLFCIFFF